MTSLTTDDIGRISGMLGDELRARLIALAAERDDLRDRAAWEGKVALTAALQAVERECETCGGRLSMPTTCDDCGGGR